MNVAVLITCFNRREKTCACLSKLFSAMNDFNVRNNQTLSLEIFLVDDGCTDGTADAVLSRFPDSNIHILKGNGSLFWAGGMRLAWSVAYKQHAKWDFYLLLNDDTNIFPNTFSRLFETHEYCIENYKIGGVYTAATCLEGDNNICTYGGSVWRNRFKGIYERLSPIGKPQLCDLANANILMVSSNVVDTIGMLSDDYQHGLADFDYSIRARKNNIPVLLTSDYCGACENDHLSKDERANKIIEMSLSERKKYFSSPIHSNKDYMRFIYNTSPSRLPIVWFGRFLNLYFPRFYYKLRK